MHRLRGQCGGGPGKRVVLQAEQGHADAPPGQFAGDSRTEATRGSGHHGCTAAQDGLSSGHGNSC
ncbi:hypothetical protein [Streptomyces sp. NPDC088726]|uniref:hypothetical protein n=1 Tax=Streptomyces sp. NPDC088726 TaxID=3365874 RepID=UPI003828B724